MEKDLRDAYAALKLLRADLTQTMLAQEAAFALQKGELETALEDLQHKLQTEERKVADAVLEQQAAKENYEFLETQQLDEKEEERRNVEAEQTEREVKLQQKMEELILEAQRKNEEEQKKLQDAHEREIAELQQKCELLELELCAEKEKKLQAQENIRARFTTALQELEASCGSACSG
eukprot:jgi/Phyca11/14133/fgenesh1_pg.PHYCAscaffold_6_\